jgi:coenzyme F420-reducing hydrogenase gamma subunit
LTQRLKKGIVLQMQKKLRVGWFTFSCSEDSTILLTEIMNDHYLEWKKLIDFRTIGVLQKRDDHADFDVVFIEGAITSDTQAEKLKDIRSRAKKLIAVGACAVIGMPSAQRNNFDPAKKKEIEPILMRFKYAPMVRRVSDVVKVDAVVPGCPMDETTFLKIVTSALKEFGIIE